jgi:hypothetical protein
MVDGIPRVEWIWFRVKGHAVVLAALAVMVVVTSEEEP